jgi:hypothetical protein
MTQRIHHFALLCYRSSVLQIVNLPRNLMDDTHKSIMAMVTAPAQSSEKEDHISPQDEQSPHRDDKLGKDESCAVEYSI